ncbi:hypothetical protein EMIHUDRAFT_218439 [Emiliania huxleyi CCMP1516]|uniref:Uncharacterized protein n=2 Tax=Emiliania huxleyi TaxID=2903 RepID=A0A0D3I8A4_EMIH1|nr:hypothetical protein EMIHUDRAFT_218439 [Emiliania huxleyi CCMP1516]EOD07489.1 hypothetical protein EMIHUDRAFT_218439 [Emiliania huxleyi CCMP1516]|eukprot:XP_005759918.1 hypothetical protein EMIHUDRAFT_218439 [Emiliania huxleyi CCMP1516]
MTGYWGEVDALHTFCEPNYASSAFVAEFWNSLGSAVYCFAALSGLVSTAGMVWQVRCGWWALLLTGLGSITFHGTMRYNAELLDELPMLQLIACATLAADGAHPWTRTPRGRALLLGGMAASLGGLTAAYLYTRTFYLFVTGFTLSVLLLFALGLAMESCSPAVGYCRVRAIGCIALGRIAWEIEERFCAAMPTLWPLHNVLGAGGLYGGTQQRGTSFLPKPLAIRANIHHEAVTRAAECPMKPAAVVSTEPPEGCLRGHGDASCGVSHCRISSRDMGHEGDLSKRSPPGSARSGSAQLLKA